MLLLASTATLLCGDIRLGVKEETLQDYYRKKEESYRKVMACMVK